MNLFWECLHITDSGLSPLPLYTNSVGTPYASLKCHHRYSLSHEFCFFFSFDSLPLSRFVFQMLPFFSLPCPIFQIAVTIVDYPAVYEPQFGSFHLTFVFQSSLDSSS